ncbi:hypothetical protein JOM56_012168 [Amanita muscaria]
MVKGNPKSSASSATRKKHAKRAIAPDQEDNPKPPTKGKSSKGKNKEPRQKMYIPPVKPSPPQPDPLDTTGLAHTLPAELLIILRSLGKKAEITKIRALEELQFSWVDKCKNREVESLDHTLSEILPVWLHHTPSLFLHSSRKIRLMAATLHASLLNITAVREQLVFFIRETATASQIENILGTWCMVAHDVDRFVSSVALKSWTESLHLGPELLPALISFVEKASLDPLGVYVYLNPPAPVAHPPPISKKSGSGRSVQVPRKEPQEPRPRPDETEESEQEKMVRIRCGAIGAIRWLLAENLNHVKKIIPLLSNPALWSALYPAEECPFAALSSFGFAQPGVRKAAWLLVQDALKLPKEIIHSLLPNLGRAVLLSAWNERDTNVHAVMWQPLLTFLRDYPSCWDLDVSKDLDGGNETENEDESTHELQVESETLPTSSSHSSPIYREFLNFLESGCGGSPLQGYPAVLVIMSTIPISILTIPEPPFSAFFTSMWTALDVSSSGLLQHSTSSAFLSSLVECVAFFVKRLRIEKRIVDPMLNTAPFGNNSEMVAKIIIEEQTKKIWDSLRQGRLVADAKVSTTLLSSFLTSLYNIQECYFAAAWDIISRGVKDSRNTNSLFVATLLKTLRDQFANKGSLEPPLISLTKDVVRESVMDIRNDLTIAESETSQVLSFLVDMLNTFREELSSDPEAIEVVDSLMNDYCLRLLEFPVPVIQTYLAVRNSEEHCLRLWHTLLSAILGQPQKSLHLMGAILNTSLINGLPSYLRPSAGELDALILGWMDTVAAGSLIDVDLSLLEKVLRAADYILSNQGLASVCHVLFSAFNHQIQSMLWKDLSTLNVDTLLRLLEVVLDIFPVDSYSEEYDSTLTSIFILGYLLPGGSSNEDSRIFLYAQRIWKQYSRRRRQEQVITKLMHRLSDLIQTTNIKLMPEHIASVTSEHASDLHIDVINHLLPSAEEFDFMLRGLSQTAIHPSLAIIDPLIAPVVEPEAESPDSDVWGYSSYARAVSAVIWLLSENRRAAKLHVWALKHILSFTVYAADFKSYPAGHSPLFSSEAIGTRLDTLLTKAAYVTTYLLNLSSEDTWRTKCLDALLKNVALDESSDTISNFLANLVAEASVHDTSQATRVLKMVLQHVLGDVGRDEADRWFAFARRLENDAPQTCMALISAIVECAPEPQRLDHYRNELASSLLSIPARQANTKGLLTLRKLAMTAPNPDTDIVFLPQHRAVNVVKACQQWISSDEDIDEEVESAMMLVFVPLVPILQTVSGAHWEFMFDIIESNLENSNVEDDMTLVALARAMKLVHGIQDLAKTNKLLSGIWTTREMQILTLVRDMLMVRLDAAALSAPRVVCRELMLTIAQDLPADLMDADCFPKMCHLLNDPTISVQKSAYHLLNIAARKRTEHFVIEASVDVESNMKIDLPEELITILQFQFEMDDSQLLWQEPRVVGYLLSWMLVFDSFQDASFKVKSHFIDQLRSLDLISRDLMPGILSLLQLKQGPARTFKLDVWSVDEYYVELFDSDFSISTPLLTAHLYYRALLSIPSLIHSWVLDCKDRQVSSTVSSYTATHFSPVLIRAELAQVKNVAGTSQLVDESFKIKVTQSTSEVTAGYAVDDHELEIKLKIPVDWPLHKIEVKDVKRVGVEEHRWRAWILAVQQSIWSHNGKVIDSLALFKKNVTLHFEGQTECAICYSIISPMDGSLPRKPCKTCRNRFHAGCLYKWFNSSHSSSCPLCRSDII